MTKSKEIKFGGACSINGKEEKIMERLSKGQRPLGTT
jgi:hypothetical protein